MYTSSVHALTRRLCFTLTNQVIVQGCRCNMYIALSGKHHANELFCNEAILGYK